MTIRVTQQRWATKENPAKRLRNRCISSANCRQPKVTLAPVLAFSNDEVVIKSKFPYREGRTTA